MHGACRGEREAAGTPPARNDMSLASEFSIKARAARGRKARPLARPNPAGFLLRRRPRQPHSLAQHVVSLASEYANSLVSQRRQWPLQLKPGRMQTRQVASQRPVPLKKEE